MKPLEYGPIYTATAVSLCMNDYCTNCGTSRVRRYTLAFDDGKTLPDARLCDPCAEAFRAEGWIDVTERSSTGSPTDD